MTSTLFKNFQLFDGLTDQIQSNAWFITDDQSGKIIARGKDDFPKADRTIDLCDKYVMPGFINVHTHITSNPATFDGGRNRSETETAVDAYQNLQTFLKSGVTFIRGCGNSYDIDIKLKKMRDKGMLKHTPEIMPSGRTFSMTGGHGDHPHSTYLVDSPDEIRKAVRTGLKKGSQLIKLMATGGVMTPGDFMADPQLSVAEMRTAVLEAHHKGKRAAAHAEGNPGIQNALDAGVDSIEHGFYVTKQEANQMVNQGTFLTPTLIAEWAIPEFGKHTLPAWEVKKAADALNDTYANISRAFRMGVKITCGTDAGTPFNGFDQTPKEMELLTNKLGMTPFEAYQCSSINSAALCDINDEYGTLEKGKFADFQVLTENPLEDVLAVQQADKQVYLHGKREF
ncbi:metal-dependent hydrolase family protein [Lentilactobacillus buchneri]|uniref:metal-dependent hydrolase family protein n=1 Tax=Lentilactobacillus buchneri TaxID=1581 RepID=UPI001290DCDB|nr:amidohydrolase family protein [Lentilactobacillus buchneri]MQM76613.1 amidohydrolase family protein [Lentilactobacillus buchneri]MQM86682.1 amidohydrolase family protein [Lentilactobacillus buchneri]MQN21147.1 amidohydrolase family protein [Lentilactobacillus buchneri]